MEFRDVKQYATIELININTSKIPNIPRGLNIMLRVINKSKIKNNAPHVMKNPFANNRGQFSESGSCFDKSTVTSVAMKMTGAPIITRGFSLTVPVTINAPAKKGDVTRATPGFFKPRYI
jgi:hypothetical protein